MENLKTILFEDQSFQLGICQVENSETVELVKICKTIGAAEVEIQNEYNILNGLDIPGVQKVKRLGFFNNRPALFLEYLPGTSLESYLQAQQPSIEEALDLSIQIFEDLASVHRANIIYKNLNSTNIILGKDNKKPTLINFTNSSLHAQKVEASLPLRELKGAYAYLSPEQTGKMNYLVDYRSDYYAFGVLMYRLFTGELPCKSPDLVEQVHFHLAQKPRRPNEINPKVPGPICEIILRLLSKNLSDRYQSAEGLTFDLHLCKRQLNQFGSIEDFVIGEHDFSEEIRINTGIYGREKELGILLESFEQTSKGSRDLVLIGGYSGIGKTTLVEEIVKPVFIKGGIIVSGKFDQYRRDVPFSAIIQALEKWVDLILAEDEHVLAEWKQALAEALGENAGIIANLVPGIRRLIGPQAGVVEVGSENDRLRFNSAIKAFFRAIAFKKVPFVLFLDDVQWADFASLEVLKLLLSKEADLHYFLVICAYRDNEAGPGHPFFHALGEIDSITPKTIMLGPLDKPAVLALLTDVFHLNASKTEEIAALIIKKTQGNPFFIRYFLESLKSERLFYFDHQKASWIWNVEKIGTQSITENVAELLTKTLHKFPTNTLKALQVASVIGGTFSLNLLARILNTENGEVLRRLQPALQNEVIHPSDGWQKSYFTSDNRLYNVPDFKFRFGHDRIRDYLYSEIPNDRKEHLHLLIGRHFLEVSAKGQEADFVFTAAGHLNKAAHLISQTPERLKLAELNLLAGKKAAAGGAYHEALGFLKAGITFLPENPWKNAYSLCLNLYNEAALTAYSSNDSAQLFECCEAVFQHAERTVDKLTAIKAQVFYFDGVVGDKTKVLSIIRTALKEFNLQIKESPGNLDVFRSLIKVRLRLSRIQNQEILDLPRVESPEHQTIMQLIAIALPAAYRSNPQLYTVLVLESILLSLKVGHTGDCAFYYAIYAVISYAAFKDIKSAKRFFELALSLFKKYSTGKELPQTNGALYTGISFFVKPAAEIFPEYSHAFRAAQAHGNNFWAAVHLVLRNSTSFWGGVNLRKLYDNMVGDEKLMAELDQKNYRFWLRAVLQMVANLSGYAQNPADLIGDWFQSSGELETNVEGGDTSIMGSIYSMKFYLACLFDDWAHAQQFAPRMKPYLTSTGAEYPTILFLFYQAVFNAVFYAEGHRKSSLLNITRRSLKSFKKMAQLGAVNYTGKPELIEGALNWAEGKLSAAEEQFNLAARHFQNKGFIHEKALAMELAGRLSLTRKLDSVAAFYLKQAILAYTEWGALAKVKHLKAKYGTILQEYPLTELDKTSTEGKSISESVDFQSILRASKVMVEEIDLEKLLEKLMRIVLENGGASRGLLILEQEGQWLIEAQAEVKNDQFEIRAMTGIPPYKSNKLPESVFNYVLRTEERLILNNAFGDDRFAKDTYILSTKIASVLCLPLVNQGKMSGILYLENSLAAGAFTQQQVEVLNILSAEMAISINNARSYLNLSQINQAYEHFVPHQFIRFLNKQKITEVRLGDQIQKDMAVMFADIRNFTTLSEQFSPEANFNFINEYLGKMEPIIARHGGFIDKYIGDEIMALFPGSAEDAVQSGINMLLELREYNKQLETAGTPPVQIGIGINIGSLMLGIIGGEERWDSTVISDAVNLASRLEGLTRDYNTPLLISEFTMEHLQNVSRFSIRKIDRLKVKGKSLAVTVYEVFDADEAHQKTLKLQTLDLFKEARKAFQQNDYVNALHKFSDLLSINPDDQVARIYFQRCEKKVETKD